MLVPSDRLYLTDFSLHSIGVILFRLGHQETYNQFVKDVLLDGSTHLVTVPPTSTDEIANVAKKFNLDFDDAYQYVSAVRHNLIVVSLDSDFDLTDHGRQMPKEVILAFEE